MIFILVGSWKVRYIVNKLEEKFECKRCPSEKCLFFPNIQRCWNERLFGEGFSLPSLETGGAGFSGTSFSATFDSLEVVIPPLEALSGCCFGRAQIVVVVLDQVTVILIKRGEELNMYVCIEWTYIVVGAEEVVRVFTLYGGIGAE